MEAHVFPSHGHGHLVVLIPTFLFIKGRLGIISIQLEGRVGRTEGELPGVAGAEEPSPSAEGTSRARRGTGSLWTVDKSCPTLSAPSFGLDEFFPRGEGPLGMGCRSRGGPTEGLHQGSPMPTVMLWENSIVGATLSKMTGRNLGQGFQGRTAHVEHTHSLPPQL